VIVRSVSGVAPALTTVNLFDSDLTSLGIGSFQVSSAANIVWQTEESAFVLSFFIPNDAASGTANIYANVFTDWPSQGGTPMTGEASVGVRIN